MARTEQSATWTKPKPAPESRLNLEDSEAADLAALYGPRFASLVAACTLFNSVPLSFDTHMTFAAR